jgi:CheY-like chemotaxis protein
MSNREILCERVGIPFDILERDGAALDAAWEEAGEAFTPLEHELRARAPDGSLRWVRLSATPARTGESIVWSGSWLDVTERTRLAHRVAELEARLAAAEGAAVSFATAVGHELRTPLTTALGTLELVARTPLDDDQRADLYLAFDASRSALNAVDEIVDFCRIESGAIALRPEPVDVAALIGELVDARQGSIACEADERMAATVMVDRRRLRQIIECLLAEAAARATGARIVVRTKLLESRDAEQKFRVSIHCEGGVPAAPGAAPRGTRLALAAGRRLAGMMGGAIEVIDQVALAAWMLTLRVPLAATAASDAPLDVRTTMPHAPRRPAPSLAEAREDGTLVLVVDDHPINRLVLLHQLNSLGYAAECAADGVEAIERWTGGRFGLVLTDCSMPEMDGYELARHIRGAEAARGRKQRIPIIAFTAQVDDPAANAWVAAGMDDYLGKPIALAQLADRACPLGSSRGPGPERRQQHGRCDLPPSHGRILKRWRRHGNR